MELYVLGPADERIEDQMVVLEHAARELHMGVHGLGVDVEGHPERLGLGRRGQEDKSQSEKEQFLHKSLKTLCEIPAA